MMKPLIEVVHKEVELKLEDGVMKAIGGCGIVADKPRVIQAFTDAKQFYKEGVVDALKEVLQILGTKKFEMELDEYGCTFGIEDIDELISEVKEVLSNYE